MYGYPFRRLEAYTVYAASFLNMIPTRSFVLKFRIAPDERLEEHALGVELRSAGGTLQALIAVEAGRERAQDRPSARLFYAQHRPEHSRRNGRSSLVHWNATQPYITHTTNRTTRPHQRSSTALHADRSAYQPILPAL